MYQFTTEVIVNSITNQNGKTKTAGSSAAQFNFLSAGTYKKSDSVVWKAAYVAPAKETITSALLAGTYTAGKTYRLAIDVKLSGTVQSDYANDFVIRNKQLFYEVVASTTTPNKANPGATLDTTTVTGMATALYNEWNKDYVINDFKYVTVADGGTGHLSITSESEYQRILTAQVQELGSDSLTGYNAFTVVDDLLAKAKAGTSGASFTAGTQGFGTVNWITKNLRLPTIENLRYMAIGADERPTAGGTYNQYTIRKTTDRGDMGGLSAMGQRVSSVTTSVFYVLVGSVATAFESALTTAGFTLNLADAPGTTGTFTLTSPDTTIVVGDFTTIVPVGAVGAVTYVSGATSKIATVGADGVTSAGLAAGTTVITGTDSAGNTATITITVIA